jgi:hypothetical protein
MEVFGSYVYYIVHSIHTFFAIMNRFMIAIKEERLLRILIYSSMTTQ